MIHTKDVRRNALAVAPLVSGLVGAGAGAAWAATPTPPAPSPRRAHPPGIPPTHPAPPPPPPPVPVADSGRIAAVDARTLSVRENNGRITVFRLTPRTTILKNGRPVAAGRLAAQDPVPVTGVRTAPSIPPIASSTPDARAPPRRPGVDQIRS